MSTIQLYWIMKLDSIRGFILGITVSGWVIGILLLITAIIASIVALSNFNKFGEDDGDYKSARSVTKYALPKSIVTLIITFILNSSYIIIPSTKEMAALIVVPKVITAISNSNALKQLPSRVVNLGNAWLEELSPNKNTAEKESN